MLAALIGWKVAGVPGAVAACLALYLPSSLLVYGAARLWGGWCGSPWQRTIERGLAPIAAGLVLAGGLAVLRAAPGGAAAGAAAVAATAILLRWPRLHPLALFAASGALFGAAAVLGRRAR